jgi:translation initiation factor 1
MDRGSRPVYSTSSGSLCPRCGKPTPGCACVRNYRPLEPVPDKVVAKLRMEKKGRGGKTVTVVYDLPRNDAFLEALAAELKKACGAGGAVVENTVEVQGEQRERLRAHLAKKGWSVKG